MKHITITSTAIVALFVFGIAATVGAGSTSPGKSSAYESYSGILPATGLPGPIVTATIAKGKAKRVLEAVATISVTGPSGATGYNMSALLEANGIAMEVPAATSSYGLTGFHTNHCYTDGATPVQGCIMTIVGWLDLDAAEAANPGVFKGQQIDVVLSGGAFDAFGLVLVSGEAVLAVRMEKK